MWKSMRNERGLTLVELLATLVIFSVIGILVVSIAVNAITNNQKVKNDIALRDEAELILVNAVKSIYTTLESTVLSVEGSQMKIKVGALQVSPVANPSLVTCEGNSCTVITGFVEEDDEIHFYVESVKVDVSNSNIKISPLSSLEKVTVLEQSNSNQHDLYSNVPTYKITLGLYDVTSEDDEIYWVENEITSINNS